jgi:hypothetical protein
MANPLFIRWGAVPLFLLPERKKVATLRGTNNHILSNHSPQAHSGAQRERTLHQRLCQQNVRAHPQSAKSTNQSAARANKPESAAPLLSQPDHRATCVCKHTHHPSFNQHTCRTCQSPSVDIPSNIRWSNTACGPFAQLDCRVDRRSGCR